MSEVDVVTDPDVLELYRERVWCDPHPSERALDAALINGSQALLWMATGEQHSASVREVRGQLARVWLTELGERAAPLPDEGVPCG